jgi:biopolymer transport protein ExbB
MSARPREEEVTVGDGGSLTSWFETGGFTAWALLALATIGVAVTIERVIALSRARIDINDFLGQVRKALVANRSPREAIRICEQFRGPAPSIVKAGLLKYGQPRHDVATTLENAARFENGRLERFLPLLGTLAAIAPLLGFLGTIAGMVRALDTLAESGAPAFAEVASALSGPLMTTAVGLSIGIVLRGFHGWLAGRVSTVGREIATASTMLLETFGEMERAGVPAVGTGDSSGAIPVR